MSTPQPSENMTPRRNLLGPLSFILVIVLFGSFLVLVSNVISSARDGEIEAVPPAEIKVETYDLEIETLNDSQTPQLAPNEDVPQFIRQDGRIIYLSAGSSSCPPSLEDATMVRDEGGEESVQLTLTEYDKNTACTMDYAPFAQVVFDEDGPISPDVQVNLYEPDENTLPQPGEQPDLPHDSR